MKVGFIGTGNMATAIIEGMIAKKVLPAEQILITGRTKKNVTALAKKTGAREVETDWDLADKADVIVVAVKPYAFSAILLPIQKKLQERDVLVVSIAAGLSLEMLAEMTSFEQKIVRVMPNINATISESMTAFCGNDNTSEEDLSLVAELFTSVGKTIEIEESQFSIFAAIAGSSPAFAYMFIDSLARGALQAGMPKEQAVEIAAQAVLGSAKMILKSKEHPFILIDKVASPGGTTIAGVAALEENKFIASVMEAVTKTIEREETLKEGLK